MPLIPDPTATLPGALLTDAHGVGIMCSVSDRTIHRLNAAGELPRPVRVGGSVRWRVDEIRAWVARGCPDRRQWEAIQKETPRGATRGAP